MAISQTLSASQLESLQEFNIGIGIVSSGFNDYDQAQFEKFGEWRVYLEKIEETPDKKFETRRIFEIKTMSKIANKTLKINEKHEKKQKKS